METEVQRIVSLLKKTFDKGAWHGPSVKEAIENITPEQSLEGLAHTHTIIELVWHMTSWRTYVTKKLTGDLDFKVTDQLNFPDSKDWHDCVKQLEESQRTLLAAIEKFPAEKLSDTVPNFKDPYSFYSLIHGIIHHDLYHAGQIMLIKKAIA
jgi:uncharacterized damage-inducible protein DinB